MKVFSRIPWSGCRRYPRPCATITLDVGLCRERFIHHASDFSPPRNFASRLAFVHQFDPGNFQNLVAIRSQRSREHRRVKVIAFAHGDSNAWLVLQLGAADFINRCPSNVKNFRCSMEFAISKSAILTRLLSSRSPKEKVPRIN